ncbi:MAG: hypothetical protein ABIP48_10265, partial [Planctomycetota bacterium]
MYGWCRQAGLQPEDAADVSQETFATVAVQLSGFRREKPGDSFRDCRHIRGGDAATYCEHEGCAGPDQAPEKRFATRLPQNAPEPIVDPDLARLVAAWPELPEHIRQTVLTLVESA